MATTLKRENKGKPTPPLWKGVGKVLIAVMGIASTTIAVLPIPSLLVKGLIIFGVNALLYLGKELTTMTFNPKQVPLTYNPNMEQAILLKAEQKVQVQEAKDTIQLAKDEVQ
jgi:hypothetical protein